MNEQEFRHALHDTMTAAAAPPPMSETPVLEAARRAQRRRKARWAGAGSAAAVAVVALVAIVVGGGSGNDVPGVPVGGSGTPTASAGGETNGGSAVPTASAGGGTKDTEPSWPNGQTDRTARSGPRFDQGEALLGEVTAVVPAGFGAPDDLDYAEPGYSGPLRFSQSQYVDTVDGVEVWEYQGVQPVTKDGGVGELFVQVTSPGNLMTGDGCDLRPTLWGLEGDCHEKVVDGKRVGVFDAKDDSGNFDTWAGYRYADGTVVFIAQSLDYPGSAKPAISSPPLSPDRLAELAVDARFPPE